MTAAARRTSQIPLKVFERTKEQVKLVSAIFDRRQAEVVEAAMDEYAEHPLRSSPLG